MIKFKKKILTALITAILLTTTATTIFAAENDGWTEASQTDPAKDGNWTNWYNTWQTIKNDPIQMSLTPGRNATELNFAWYSKVNEANPKIKIGKKQDMSDANELSVITKDAVSGFRSNKSTASNLEENTTYYYSYEVNGTWSNSTLYKTQSTKSFSFLFVGDPQIGSSADSTATGASDVQGQDNAVANDSFNWNNTINTALKSHPNMSFILSAGDQIQSRDKKKPSQTYDKNEIEYSGYLSPSALKSLPVATSIGNHDAPSGNYSFHFNNPNASTLGLTDAGGDYYYTYGNTLFIMLNTNNTNVTEHQQLIEKAISENKDVKWRIVTMHQDIYGSGEHSNEPEMVNLRHSIIPIFEKNNIDVVLSGHDHTYSRSLILKGGVTDQTKLITEDEFDDYIDGITPINSKFNDYLTSIQDSNAIQNVTLEGGKVVNPKGILYMTANSASGSKYYDTVKLQQAYIASRWQGDVPTYSTFDIDNENLTINTYRTDTGEKIDDTYSIIKKLATSVSNEVVTPIVNNGQITEAKDIIKSAPTNSVKTGDNFSYYTIFFAILSLVGLVYLINEKRALRKIN